MNSDTSSHIFGRRGTRTGRLKDFRISRLQLFKMIDELFGDTAVICHHEKLSASPSVLMISIKVNITKENENGHF